MPITLEELKKRGEIKIISKPQIIEKETQQQPQKKEGFFEKAKEFDVKSKQALKDVGVGALKGIGSTLWGAGQLGAKVLGKIPGSYKPEQTQQFAEDVKQKFLTPEGVAQKTGFLGEQIAEFLIPGSASLKAGKAVSGMVKGGKMIKGLAGLATTSLGEGILGFGQTAIQKGEIDKEVKQAGAIGVLTPPALKAGGKILKVVGAVGKEILGKTTGAGKQAIVEAFNNPEVMKLARKANIDMGSFQDDVLSSLKSGISDIAESRSKTYTSQLSKLKLQPREYDNVISDLRSVAKENFDKFNLSIIPEDKLGNKLNQIDFSKSTMINGKNVVENAWNDLMSWTDETAGGLDTLKKRMYQWRSELPNDAKSAYSFLSNMSNGLDKSIKNNVKGYKEMTGAYAQASNLLEEINNAFKPGGSKETTIKKILGSLRENNEVRKELLDMIGGRELINKVAATQLAPKTPRGLAGALVGGGLGMGGAIYMINPHTWPILLSSAAATSPRLVGNLASVLGKITRPMIENKTLPLNIARELREITIKLYNE